MNLLERLRGGLIVSVQAWDGSAIDDPSVLASIALAAERNGARALRMQGLENLRAARARISIPMIGIIKRRYDGYEPYITPTLAEVDEIVATGVEIVAFDATPRARPGGVTVAAIIQAIHARGAVAMADCATFDDARAAREAGAEIVASTLCGYTSQTKGAPLPALQLVGAMAALPNRPFVICEGGVGSPASVGEAFAAGADAVVVGTAITNVDALVQTFVAAAQAGFGRA